MKHIFQKINYQLNSHILNLDELFLTDIVPVHYHGTQNKEPVTGTVTVVNGTGVIVWVNEGLFRFRLISYMD